MKRIKFVTYFFTLFLVLFLVLSASYSSFAGLVRTVYVDDNKTENINLHLGNATVLNFLEKPLKVTIGNKNYFNVEFVGNDVTIQPLHIMARTNFFVYGKYHRYALILKVVGSEAYDDVVKVRWKEDQPTPIQDNAKEINFNNVLSIQVTKVLRDTSKKFLLIDFNCSNLGSKPIVLEDLKISATQDKTPIVVRKIVYEKDKLGSEESSRKTKGRLILLRTIKEDFTLEFTFQNKKQTLTIKEVSN